MSMLAICPQGASLNDRPTSASYYIHCHDPHLVNLAVHIAPQPSALQRSMVCRSYLTDDDVRLFFKVLAPPSYGNESMLQYEAKHLYQVVEMLCPVTRKPTLSLVLEVQLDRPTHRSLSY